MERINQVLKDLVKARGTNESVAKPLGVTPQALGRYMKGRTPPLSFVLKWKEVYKEDLLALSEPASEPIVSRETHPENQVNEIESLNGRVKAPDFYGIIVDTMNRILNQNDSLIASRQLDIEKLHDDKAELRERQKWMYGHIDALTSKINTAKDSKK